MGDIKTVRFLEKNFINEFADRGQNPGMDRNPEKHSGNMKF